MSDSSTNSGTNIIGLLGIAFVILKLMGFIDWSWWWVTIPFWGGLVAVIIVLGVYFLYRLLTHKKDTQIKPPIKKNRFQEKLSAMMKEAEKQKESK